MKEIKLTQGKVALIDDEDYGWLNQWKWHYTKSKKSNTGYVVRSIRLSSGKQTTIQMHRVILDLKFGDKKEADHINHNGLDNRKENLKIVIKCQNRMNSQGDRKTSSIFKGVHWNKQSQKWRAMIGFNGKLKHLGLFISETKAAIAYNQAAQEIFGEYAKLNILQGIV